MQNVTFVPTYHDRLLRGIGVPILGLMYRHIGEPSPLIHLLRDPVYYVDLVVCIATVWAVWQLAKLILQRLDKHYSWMNNFFQRLVIQLIVIYGFSVFFTLMVTFIYNDMLMYKYRHQLYDINFAFVIDIPVSLLMLTIIQLLYYALYLQENHKYELKQLQNATVGKDTPTAIRKNVLAYFGKSLLPIALEDIAYFHKVGEVTLVRNFDNQDYRIDQTLEQLQTMMSVKNFYRLNRQILVNMDAVKEVKSDASSKLLVTLEPGYAEVVTVSRKKASEFKHWLNG